MGTCRCAHCQKVFDRYKMNAKRAAQPQFCCRDCQTQYRARLADGRREARFWSKVDRSGECWLWTGFRNDRGYGMFRLSRGKNALAHRYALTLAIGTVPELFVCHRCDNPSCVRPDHLFLGTQKDNMQDCVQKGRINRKANVQGSSVKTAKLCESQVLAIRSSHHPMSELAEQYGVSRTCIYYIRSRRSWAWLTQETE